MAQQYYNGSLFGGMLSIAHVTRYGQTTSDSLTAAYPIVTTPDKDGDLR